MNQEERDGKLLQAAARAAGIDGHIEHDGTILYRGRSNKGMLGSWNPLSSTDEAIELAKKLNINVSIANGSFVVSGGSLSTVDNLDEDGATLRRAIVRTAAHIGGLTL